MRELLSNIAAYEVAHVFLEVEFRMDDPQAELIRLCEEDPEIKHIFEIIGELNEVYLRSMEAMGLIKRHTSEVSSTANITLTLHASGSTAGH